MAMIQMRAVAVAYGFAAVAAAGLLALAQSQWRRAEALLAAPAAVPGAAADSRAGPPGPPVFDAHLLRGSPLFGRPSAEELLQEEAVRALPPTELPLELVGVVSDSRPGAAGGGAIIRSEGEARWYGVREEVPGGHRLLAVSSGAVVLEGASGLERLAFEEEAELAAAGERGHTPAAHRAPAGRSGPAGPSLRERLRRLRGQ